MEVRIIESLYVCNTRVCPKFPILLGGFTLLNVPHEKKEATNLKELILCTRVENNHEPIGVL
jgi:hypothetical protein